MKPGMLLDETSARAFDFDWLRQAVEPASDYGDRAFELLRPFVAGEEAAARASAQRVAGFAAALSPSALDTLREVFRSVPDATTAIARASMGDTLADTNFLELQRFYDAVARVDAVIAGAAGVPPIGNDAVQICARALQLGRAGKFGFYLSDSFDQGLTKARGALAQAQAEYDAARGRASARVAHQLGREEISGTEFIVMRGDIHGSLPIGVRVVREAPTYVLCELDLDEQTLRLLERRDALSVAVAETEEAVRDHLSGVVRTHAAALDQASRAFGEVDVLVAAARFAQAHDACVPEIALDSVVSFADGRFSPMAEALQKQGRSFTPISIALDDVAVLTGPNMGGKSVCIRTCGFIAICAAFGLPVPAKSARVGLFDEIAWLGIGAEDDRGGLLSSFAGEVVRLRDVLERKRERRFVLLDEFARTTSPREGRALLVAVIERLRATGARGLAATHLSGVARAANVRHFAVRGLRGIPERPQTNDLREALAALALSMDYTIMEVTGDRRDYSDAIALAALLGLDTDMIAAAYEAMAT